MIIIGANDLETDRLWLDHPEEKKSFFAETMEHFECYGLDVGEIKRVEARQMHLWCKLFLKFINIRYNHIF